MHEALLVGSAKIILALIAGLLVTVLPFWVICKRMGLHPALSFLSIIPLASIIFRFYLAIVQWPTQSESAPADETFTPSGKSKKKLILVTTGAFMLILAPLTIISGTAYTLTLPKIYASHTLLQTVFSETAYKSYDKATLESLTHTYAEKITSTPVLSATATRLNLPIIWGPKGKQIPKEVALKILKSSTKVLWHRNSVDLITISVQRQDPKEAARIANTLAQVYQDVSADDTKQANPYSIVIIEKAEPATRPVSPNLILNVLISIGAAGVFILVGTPLFILGLKR
ncbi:MAG: hypothetical protein WC334_01285 [Kiritimatiellales bacterium]|jgi:capsular polysaccharide biosynthesis protein